MNIYVCIKQVPDTETKIKLSGDSQSVDLSGVKFIISPYDEFAIEEALRFKEKNAGATVTVISAGPARVTDAIRTALAMGADNGVHVDLAENADNAMAAKALAKAIQAQGAAPHLIYSGKEAIDDSSAQTSQLIAHHLGIPFVTVALGIEYSASSLKVRREIEGGAIEVLQVQIPALIAAQKGLNEPRYASLPNIMKAKKKEIKVVKASELGVEEKDRKIRFKNFQLPPPKQAGKKIEGDPATQAKELTRLLREEAKVV